MKICMIGGTGLLGAEAAKVMIAKGHKVSTLALPPLPEGAPIPEEMEIIFQDINKWSDADIENWLKGADAFVFAAGVDERVEMEAPVLPKYHKFNIAPLERIFPLCKKAGVKHATVLGSYFAYWAKMHPEKPDYCSDRNPYIQSRLAQEQFCKDSCDENFSVDVLELPYIFGTQPGRRPVWTILIDKIKMMDKWPFTMYPWGGTAMLTCRQVGECICGSATRQSKGYEALPCACYNMKWGPFLKIVYNARGMGANRPILYVPPVAMKLGLFGILRDYKKRNIESGTSLFTTADLMGDDIFIDTGIAESLGATPDDIEAAIFDSIKLSVAAVEGTAKLLGMKGE